MKSSLWVPRHIDQIDADEIAHNLWQGSAPQDGKLLRKAGFHALVLAAREYQPTFRGIKIFRLKLDDVRQPLTLRQRIAVHQAATWVCDQMNKGRVLVTCQAGLNRSGLVSAAALIMKGEHPRFAVTIVRMSRQWALNNQYFVDYLLSL